MATNLSVLDRLTRLLTYHDNAAAAVRSTIALLKSQNNGHGDVPTLQRQALALDQQRQEVNPKLYKRGPYKPHKPRHMKRVRAQRERSAKILAEFDLKEPRRPKELNAQGLGSLVRRGYLQQKGKGLYVRTTIPYYVNPKDAAR